MKFSLIFVIIFIALRVEADMNAGAKHRCEEYTSIFENDTIELQYDYCENIDDGRGFTSGRAGFCTGTGDAVEVVRKYTHQKSDNPLAKYLPELERLAKEGSDDVSKLGGYCKAWQQSAKDSAFRKVQDDISDETYYRPAIKHAQTAGVKSQLGMCAFYDCIIQHGDGDDQDSINAIIKKTHGGHVSGDEKSWLKDFLKNRRADLMDPHDKDTRDEWRQSVDRVDAMVKLLDAGNMDFKGPMHIKTPNHDATIPA
ncbi:chitosanase-like [Oppia nitens]|uniref:chitosanase-like n=1 Tax=Oppia nitens TaxID=1686743 RepID=UPI0023DABBDE|nr:chitosanase-like [Oppia nitens]